jgi:hypothetical protein
MDHKYLKYKSKYLALKKKFGQFGGAGFRITIDATVKLEIVKDAELSALFGTGLKTAIPLDSPASAKLLALYKSNPTWTMRSVGKPIPREGLVWEDQTSYTLEVPKAAAAAEPAAAPTPAALIPGAAARLPPGTGLRLVTPPEFEAFATATLATGYLDLRPMPAATPAAILTRRYQLDSEYTPTTCAGQAMHTIFDTGNASHTICARRKVVALQLMVKPKMASKSSILSYNELAHITGLPKVAALPTAAAPRQTGVATFASSAAATLQAAEAVEFAPKTLREFTSLLDAGLPRLMAHPIGPMLLGIHKAASAGSVAGSAAESAAALYSMCGIHGVSGFGGGSAVCFEETYVPVEAPVVAAGGASRPPLKLLFKADVGDLPGSVDLLVSLEDIRKLSLHGTKLDFSEESHRKRDELLKLKEEVAELEPRLQIYIFANSTASSSEESRQSAEKIREIDARLRVVYTRIRALIEHNIPVTEL